MKLGHSSNNLNDTGQHKKSLLNAKNMTQCLHVSFYTNDEAHACISLCICSISTDQIPFLSGDAIRLAWRELTLTNL